MSAPSPAMSETSETVSDTSEASDKAEDILPPRPETRRPTSFCTGLILARVSDWSDFGLDFQELRTGTRPLSLDITEETLDVT